MNKICDGNVVQIIEMPNKMKRKKKEMEKKFG